MDLYMIVGDPHLGNGSIGKSVPGQHINSRVQDQFDIFEWIFQQALSKKATGIILTGDVFHSPTPHFIIIDMFAEWCVKVKNAGIELLIVAGNHDILRFGSEYRSPLDLIEKIGIKVINEITTIHGNGINLTLLPFRDRKSLSADTTDEGVAIIQSQLDMEISKLSPTSLNVCVGHLAIKGSVYYDEVKDMTNELVFPAEMFDFFDRTVMGHIHSPQEMSDKVCHIGSMDISNFGETDQVKKVIFIGKDHFEEVVTPTRKLNHVNITVPKDVKDPTAYIINELKSRNVTNSIFKLDIVTEDCVLKIDRKMIESSLLSDGAFHVSAISESNVKEVLEAKTFEISIDTGMENGIAVFARRRFGDDEKRAGKFMSFIYEIIREYEEKLLAKH